MGNVRKLVIVLVLAAMGYATAATFVQAANPSESPSGSPASEMSTKKLILQVPVQIEIPETGVSGLTLVARADEGAGLIRCGGPTYVLLNCTPGIDTATLVIADVNNRWFAPNRSEWVGSFHLWRVDFESGSYNIVVEAIRADDDEGNPIEIPPMTVSVTVE